MDIVDVIMAGEKPKEKQSIEFTIDGDLVAILDDLNERAGEGSNKRSRIRSMVVNQALRYYFKSKGLIPDGNSGADS